MWLSRTASSLGSTDLSSLGAATSRLHAAWSALKFGMCQQPYSALLQDMYLRCNAVFRMALAMYVSRCNSLWMQHSNQSSKAHLGPMNCTGLQRSEKMGSVRMESPAICTRRLACPSHVTCSPFSAAKQKSQAPLLSQCSIHQQEVMELMTAHLWGSPGALCRADATGMLP